MGENELTVADLRQAIVNARMEGEEGNWKAGKLIVDVIVLHARELPKTITRQERRAARYALAKDIASENEMSPARVVQLAQLHAELGEIRKRDKSWTWHRAVYLAAKRTRVTPLTMLEQAEADGMTVPDLNRHGQKPKPGHGASYRGHCNACGCDVHYVAKGETGTALRGLAPACGVCVGKQQRAHEPIVVAMLSGMME